MKPFVIVWQRLVVSGETCTRCGTTYEALQQAVTKLKAVLNPLGFEPMLEVKEIDEKTFQADPSTSNRIWIAGRPFEEWLDARVGSSRCCSVCGDSNCRTVEIGGTRFESIPEDLILKAALVAVSQLITPKDEPLSNQSQSDSIKCCDDRQ
jgi:hypothetical protein